MGGSGPSQTTQKTTNSLPPWATPTAQNTLTEAANYYLGNTAFPQGAAQSVAPWSQDQIYGMGLTENATTPANAIANQGINTLTGIANNGMGAASGLIQDTLSGKYLDPNSNPYLKATYDAAAKGVTSEYQDSVAPSLMAEGETASGGGPGALAGSSGFNQAQSNNEYVLGETLNNLATNIYGGNYQQERSRQMQAGGLAEQGVSNQLSAAGLIPSTQSALYTPANELTASGAAQQQQAQNILNTTSQNARDSALWPGQQFQGLANILATLAGNAGSQVTVGPNPQASK